MRMRTTRVAAGRRPVRGNFGSGGWLARVGLLALLVAAPALCVAQHRSRGGSGWSNGGHGFSAMQRQTYRAPAARPYRGGFERGPERGPAMRVANRGDFRPRQGQEARRTPERRQGQSEGRQQRQPQPGMRRQEPPENRQRRESAEGQRQQPRSDYRQQARPNGGRMQPATRRGQERLSQWWQAHRGLSPEQQADALRRQPGFHNLPQGQQQRLIHRLHDFDRRSPAEQQRTLNRVEMFERLSPERRQEVRGASQALSQMPPERQRTIRDAFHELRQMPPGERERMLHSSYGAQFTPRERTVLGNLLAIEPYQPQGQVVQPYFGKR